MSPPRVDFYLLETAQPHAVERLACRLVAKAYALKHQIYIYCVNQQQAQLLDQLLWTFDESSFLPHLLEAEHSALHLEKEGPETTPWAVPILIGWQEPPIAYRDILVNLTNHTPATSLQVNRLIEIIANDSEAKAQSRERYRYYRSNQCELHLHRLD